MHYTSLYILYGFPTLTCTLIYLHVLPQRLRGNVLAVVWCQHQSAAGTPLVHLHLYQCGRQRQCSHLCQFPWVPGQKSGHECSPVQWESANRNWAPTAMASILLQWQSNIEVTVYSLYTVCPIYFNHFPCIGICNTLSRDLTV